MVLVQDLRVTVFFAEAVTFLLGSAQIQNDLCIEHQEADSAAGPGDWSYCGSWATIDRADVMIWRKLSHAFARRAADSLLDELSDHADKSRVVARRSGTDHVNGLSIAESARFIIKVVKHFHVV